VVRDGTALVFSGLAGNGRGVATTLPSQCCLASAAATVVAIVNVELHSFVLCSSSSSTFYHPHWHQTLDRLHLLNDAACCWWCCLLPAATVFSASIVDTTDGNSRNYYKISAGDISLRYCNYSGICQLNHLKTAITAITANAYDTFVNKKMKVCCNTANEESAFIAQVWQESKKSGEKTDISE